MKKNTILSFATAGAIIATSAGTYAAWDSLVDDTSANITFRKPVTVTVGESYTLAETPSTLDTLPIAEGTVNFTIENDGDLANTLTIVPSVSGGSSATVDDFDFVIVDSSEGSTPTLVGDATDGFVDKTLTSTNYTVKVTPKDGSAAKVAGQEVKISLTATLSKSE